MDESFRRDPDAPDNVNTARGPLFVLFVMTVLTVVLVAAMVLFARYV